jgi:predicted DNA-binding protein
MGQAAVRDDRYEDVGWLVEAMTRMMRPIVRFAVGRISCSALVNLIREIYVEEARDYLQAQNPDRKVTRSALSLLCGLDGRVIKTFEEANDRRYSASDVCSEAAILEMWNRDDDFADPQTGAPADLLIHGPHGTFQRLVSRSAGRAVTPQTALDRLIESGNVELVDNETRVRLVDPVYKPVRKSEKTAIEAGSLAINRLGRSVVHNTSHRRAEDPSWLQQDRWSLRIPPERLDAIREEVREILQRHIGEVEDYLESEEGKLSEASQCSVGIGWYYWEDAARIASSETGRN